jgi:large subunit ribosomal protein L31
MKPEIHPNYAPVQVTCSCGAAFVTRSTKGSDIHTDFCAECHPFYTGKQKIMDVGGRVQKFERRYGKRTAPGSVAATDEASSTAAN